MLCAWALAADQVPSGFDCVITPLCSVDLAVPVPGQIHEVLVDRSSRVRARQVVASPDSRREKVFQLELALLPDARVTGVGGCADVRLHHGSESLWLQWARSLRQLLLSRLQT